MKTITTISGKNESALMEADFAVVVCLLQDDRHWGANLLDLAGEYAWRVKLLRMVTSRVLPSGIRPKTTEAFTAYGVTGKRTFITYEVQKVDDHSIRITPVGYVPRAYKIISTVGLAIPFIIPALLAPLTWKVYNQAILRLSKMYLDVFCRYIENGLNPVVET